MGKVIRFYPLFFRMIRDYTEDLPSKTDDMCRMLENVYERYKEEDLSGEDATFMAIHEVAEGIGRRGLLKDDWAKKQIRVELKAMFIYKRQIREIKQKNGEMNNGCN